MAQPRSSAPWERRASVLVLVIFMLLEREDLRGRIISVVGHGHLAVTTRAFEEAGARVSRQLLMQGARQHDLRHRRRGRTVADRRPVLRAVGVVGGRTPFHPVRRAAGRGRRPVAALAALPGWTRPVYVARSSSAWNW